MWFKKHKAVSTDPARIDELLSRGVVEAIVKEKLKEKLLSGKRLRVKLGIDPTSPNLHIGRAVPLLKLRDFQELGHQIVFIIGDFTAVIGDTSDKESERPMLAREVIEKNKKTYLEQAGKVLDLSLVECRYNSEWLEPLDYRQIGEHADCFSVADFIARENIAKRLEGGKRVSLREVLYPLLQGYDSVAVHADVELGGTDQKFNLLAGRVLQERFGQVPQDILMNPLIEGLDGRKMSSSWGNVINLTDEASDMYGKVMSMGDAQIISYLTLCTRMSLVEVAAIEKTMKEGSLHPKDAKMRLAREMVTLYHGKDAAEKAQKSFTDTFSKGEFPADAPVIEVARGTTLRDALRGVVSSNSELTRLFEQGAIQTEGGEHIKNPLTKVEASGGYRIGKKEFRKIVVK